MRRFQAKIIVSSPLSPQWRVLGFEWPKDLEAPRPGQFFTCRPRASWGQDAGLLRRPLAFAGMSGNAALAIYQVRGAGTKALAAIEPGETLDIIAPLGKGFPSPGSGETPVLLGGGIGIGPMLFLHSSFQAPSLFLGFRSGNSIPKFDSSPQLRGLSDSLAAAVIATDDGSSGLKGTALAIADNSLGLSGSGSLRPHLYACGPAPMLAELDRFCSRKRFAAHISVEQWMACGVGACHGCVLPSISGVYVRACADGPVFEAGIIDWEGELHA